MYKVNLLPPELLTAEFSETPRRSPVIGIFVCTVGLLCLLYVALAFYTFNTRVQVNEINNLLIALEPEILQVETLQSRTEFLKSRAAAWRRITEERRTYYPVLTDLHRVLPVDMWLTSVAIAQQEAGGPVQAVIQGGTGSLASVGVYVNNLSRLSYLNSVALIELKQVKNEGKEPVTVFTVKADMRKGGR